MRLKPLTLGLTVVLGACASVRQPGPPNPTAVAVPAPIRTAVQVAPPTTPGHLACHTHPSIDAWEQRLRREGRFRNATETSLARGQRYLPRMRKIATDAGLPSSIALLPAIESSFSPGARGGSSSRGLWQLRPPTARRFGLVVNKDRDDRMHPLLATEAAVRYLRFLHDRYDDWPLALAAYNCGEGRVDRALMRSPGATFWDLAEQQHLPRISRDYVPRFLALVRVAEDEIC
jgi:membrane-bound lytic murein transglycosylase D